MDESEVDAVIDLFLSRLCSDPVVGHEESSGPPLFRRVYEDGSGLVPPTMATDCPTVSDSTLSPGRRSQPQCVIHGGDYLPLSAVLGGLADANASPAPSSASSAEAGHGRLALALRHDDDLSLARAIAPGFFWQWFEYSDADPIATSSVAPLPPVPAAGLEASG